MYTNEQITKDTTTTKLYWPKWCRLVHTWTKQQKQKALNNLLNQNGLTGLSVLVAACGGRPRVPHALTFRVRQGATLSLCWTNKPAVDEQAQTAGMVIEPCLVGENGKKNRVAFRKDTQIFRKNKTKQNTVLNENKKWANLSLPEKKGHSCTFILSAKRSWIRSSVLQVCTSFHGTLGMVPVLVCDFPDWDTRTV